MDIRRYIASSTIAQLGARDEDFGFSQGADFITKPKETVDLISEYVNNDGSPYELICSAQIGIMSTLKL